MADNKAGENYRSYLKRKHGKWATKDILIENEVRKATGSNLLKKERIISGEVNEVYDVVTEDKQQIIVRISHNQDSRFQAEKWAIGKSLEQGVPAPKILLIDTVETETEKVAICVESKMEGEILRSVLGLKRDDKDVKEVIKSAGLILAKIHRVRTTGFGGLDKNGKGSRTSWSRYILEVAKDRSGLIEVAKKLEFDPNVIDEAIEILTRYKDLYEGIDPRLIHGDYGPKHILVKGGEICGIIDFENCKSGDQVFDFAWWDFFRGRELPVEWLKEGYVNKELFDDKFDLRLHLYKIHLGLAMLRYYESEQNVAGINHTKEEIKRDLGFFREEHR